MFRTLTNYKTDQLSGTNVRGKDVANAVLSVNPLQLSRWLEEVWSAGGIAGDEWSAVLGPSSKPLEDIVSRSRLSETLLATFPSGLDKLTPVGDGFPITGWEPKPWTPISGTPSIWRHMLYAYLVESTGLFEILAEVVRRYVVGETLPVPTTATAIWVRSTEELFFRDPPLFSAGGAMTSQLRPDARINRRSAYWRMFGLDLPHPLGGTVQGQPWKRDVGATSNVRFLEIWNELLRQVWLGYENDSNTSGAKPTDSSYIAYLCQALSEMLQLRRQGGLLSRDEFAYVTMLSWFHLTVEHDTAVVDDLSANAGLTGNAADRLTAIGAKVGIAPSRQARELFELADKISPLMWAIEIGMFNASSAAETLYKHPVSGSTAPDIASELLRIIDLWQSATGEPIKALAVTQRRAQGPPARSAQPARLLPAGGLAAPAPAPAPRSSSGVPSTNGHRVGSRG
ncbi:MAG: hypothetical protein ABW137_23455 [Mycobacterium sp.]